MARRVSRLKGIDFTWFDRTAADLPILTVRLQRSCETSSAGNAGGAQRGWKLRSFSKGVSDGRDIEPIAKILNWQRGRQPRASGKRKRQTLNIRAAAAAADIDLRVLLRVVSGRRKVALSFI
ncbi:hypothetical protein R1flu_012702 [Riccia fluitans]|uniref:Uncharacterized protein n=1 Tax=Riccia fluitans TaxID=41844 RepID=A0ABD1ZBJ2_9MARC